MPRRDPKKGPGEERGPKINEDVCIAEDVKIGIHLAVERFRLDQSKEELNFPSSLSTTERAYVHRWCETLGGLRTRSRGHAPNRCICVTKYGAGAGKVESTSSSDFLNLSKSDMSQICNLQLRFPTTSKEKEDIAPITVKKTSTVQDAGKDKQSFGRLVSMPAQIPPKHAYSDLSRFRETLPVYKMGQEIIETITENPVCLVAGETGSGKTTQVPQLIMEDCQRRKVPCRILCTQPRRIAAITIAERVAAERGERLGNIVGYQIRLENKVSPKTLLTFCTAGVVLRSLIGCGSSLGTVTHILVDEVHERDKFVDFLLLCLREALPRHPNLKLILMSATLNMELFSQYFDNCPIICVPGNLHQVDEHFLEEVLTWTDFKTPAMRKFLDSENSSLKKVEENLLEWVSKEVDIPNAEQTDSDFEEDSDLTTSDAVEEIGEEKENLDPEVKEEMDNVLQEIWLTGNKDLFHKVLHLISREHVSVDYAQRESSATALMIAAGRGFVDMVEHLLNLGASINARTINDWTVLDFAKQFGQQDVVQLLEAYAFASESNLASVQDESLDLISEDERALLTAYQHSFDDDKIDTQLLSNLIFKIHSTCDEGAILVFLPGYDDIANLHIAISKDQRCTSKRQEFALYTLHSSIQASDQKKIFKATPRGVRKIILSTNIAETSVTINDVVYVIDAGKVKEKTFDSLSNFTMLKSNWISKASALQRKGRAGRCQPGKCYHMFSRGRYMHLQDYPTPEILRLPLQELCLQTKLLALNEQSIADFISKCPQAPPPLVILNAVTTLKEIDALDQFEDLTELGHHLSEMPVEPRLGKMVLFALVLRCLDPVLTIVCTLAHREPFLLPSNPLQKRSVMGTRRKFAEITYSDHFVFLRAFQLWQKACSEGWEFAFCEKNGISSSCMQMLVGMRMQLLNQLKASGFLNRQGSMRDVNANSDNWAVVKACLVAGTYPNILQKKNSTLNSRKIKQVSFHTSSVLAPSVVADKTKSDQSLKKIVRDLPSRWLIFDEMNRIGRNSQARCCTLVSPLSVFLFAGPSRLRDDVLKRNSGEEGTLRSSTGGVILSNKPVSVFKPDDWLTFHCYSCEASEVLNLRMKFYSLFLNRMRYPHKSWSQQDESVLKTVTSLLSSADLSLGLMNPIGVGQRPRSMVIMGSGAMDDFYGSAPQQYQQQQQQGWNHHGYRRLTSQSSGSQSGHLGREEASRSNGDQGSFLIMKASSHKLLEISQTKGLWATSPGHEGKLNRLFQTAQPVYLIFSVQGSGHFQGYARMTSAAVRSKCPDFPGPGFSAVVAVEWIKSAHLPFQLCHHLLNPWNDNKKVQESRDGQEVESNVGIELLRLWDQHHHQLKPFKVSQHHRGPRSGGSKPFQNQRQQQAKFNDKSWKGQGSGDRVIVGKTTDVSSPSLSTSSSEECSGNSPQQGGSQSVQDSAEDSTMGLLGESPSGLIPLSLQHGAVGNGGSPMPLFYGNLQQQQGSNRSLMGAACGGGRGIPYLMGQSYLMEGPGSPMMMIPHSRGNQHFHGGRGPHSH